jgi:putative redox protein
MMPVSVTHDGGDRFSIAIRGHAVHVDQPEPDGGSDTGPTPTELFVASLAACVAFYARRYLKRHDLPEEGLAVTAQAESGTKPSRVASITITLTLPEGIPQDKREALLAVASHCTVHNTLTHPPEVLVQLAD